MSPDSFDLALPGAVLHGEARGEQPSAIFLHGFGGSLEDWQPVWDRLPASLAAVRYDLRGFGRSRAQPGPFSHAEDLLALLDARGIARADLVGLSMGGSIAVRFALDHPERVNRLVLISPGLMGWDWSDEWRARWRAITARARAGEMDAARGLWAEHTLFDTVRDGPAASLLLASISRYSGREWIADHQRPVLPDVDRLPLLMPPTLLLSGNRDMPDFRLIADLVSGAAPSVERIDFADCGHLLTLEAPERCAGAVAAFLARS